MAKSTLDARRKDKEIEPAVVNGSVHIGHKQHQRNFPKKMRARAWCELGLGPWRTASDQTGVTWGTEEQFLIQFGTSPAIPSHKPQLLMPRFRSEKCASCDWMPAWLFQCKLAGPFFST